ncbi:uncharacterized protein PGTG_09523 [Puccinia graminis f. sp. tritici CRL 75-36-700-3]|uniref:DNA-directed RNA polymerase III subunit RPC9 n=1 Tax=Puccinia graminis f. sp. tritici (strain CRL 75-36-700-3 / race SCCL) TaxID=418459 RepID=E3KHN5_PUCGT|nr:uncharacterized protein PGTG_09523 [Puccinia graminis f. sp. tritici CRL 75-36-700-3]EFP83810.1 hypothetical protein PGTG_09523 [Puccinia graminis f. sp. tritici CRL 75-36-700-3]
MVAGGVSSEFLIASAGIANYSRSIGNVHNNDETGVTVIPVVGFYALKARAPCLKSGGRLKTRHGHIADPTEICDHDAAQVMQKPLGWGVRVVFSRPVEEIPLEEFGNVKRPGRMEILNPNLIPLSAFETLELVREIKTKQELEDQRAIELNANQQPQQLPPQPNNNLDQLVKNILTHFEHPNHHLPQAKQSTQSILSLCESLRNRFGQVSGRANGLTKAERLQICDLAPTELVEIYLIIEECDSRFTEEEIQEIIDLVKQNLSTDRRTTHTLNHKPVNSLQNGDTENDRDGFDYEEDPNFNLGDIDDDDALVAEAREGGPPADQELDEVPD